MDNVQIRLQKALEQAKRIEEEIKERRNRELSVAGLVLEHLLQIQPQAISTVNNAAAKLNLNKRDNALFNSFINSIKDSASISKDSDSPANAPDSPQTQKVQSNVQNGGYSKN